jgi:hypothetical protein
VSKTHGTTRTGYRYGIVPVQELVDQASGHFTQACTEEGCWLVVQGGDRAMADHRRTVHRDR